MEYISNSFRKIGHFFSSPLPASTLGKRKASSLEGVEPIEELGHADREGSSNTRDSVSDREPDSYCGYQLPQPPQRRIREPTATSRAGNVLHSANKAMRKAQIAMGKVVNTQTVQPEKQDMQKEAKRRRLQEDDDRKALLEHQRKSQTTAVKPKKGLVDVSNKVRQITGAEVLTSKGRWSIEPNRHARKLLERHNHDAAAMLKDLQEPDYACRDAEIRDAIWKMMDQIKAFAKEHFGFLGVNDRRLRQTLDSMKKETVKIIGCVASGGPAGPSGWEDLFLVSDKRQALVCAIVGNVLVEQVFHHIFFGGTEDQIKEVSALQLEHRYKDGFNRNTLYANKIHDYLTSTSRKGKAPIGHPKITLQLPENFNAHINHIVAALYTHLKPILHLIRVETSPSSSIVSHLHSLTTLAAILSLQMRLDNHTVYHMTPVFKEQPFLRSEMECLNHSAMVATHPWGEGDEDLVSRPKQEHRKGVDGRELSRMKRDVGLVQITLMPGFTAYRPGGWETLSSTAENVQYEEGCEGKGVRVRQLTNAWVYCRWGRQRVWEDGKLADDPEMHGVEWKDGGFVDFFPGVEGVTDPDPDRTARKKRARRKKTEQEAAQDVAVEEE